MGGKSDPKHWLRPKPNLLHSFFSGVSVPPHCSFWTRSLFILLDTNLVVKLGSPLFSSLCRAALLSPLCFTVSICPLALYLISCLNHLAKSSTTHQLSWAFSKKKTKRVAFFILLTFNLKRFFKLVKKKVRLKKVFHLVLVIIDNYVWSTSHYFTHPHITN